jgi:hypothetical protein
MGHGWKWGVSFLWESLPSSVQDYIRKWFWDIIIGTGVMVAYFAWKAAMTATNQSWDIVTLVGLGFFTFTLYLVHFLRTRLPSWKGKVVSPKAEETDLDRSHNRRTVPLRIEFSATMNLSFLANLRAMAYSRGTCSSIEWGFGIPPT